MLINKQNGSKLAAIMLTVILATQAIQSAATLALCNLSPQTPLRPGCYDAIHMWADLYAKVTMLMGALTPGPDGYVMPIYEGQIPPRRL